MLPVRSILTTDRVDKLHSRLPHHIPLKRLWFLISLMSVVRLYFFLKQKSVPRAHSQYGRTVGWAWQAAILKWWYYSESNAHSANLSGFKIVRNVARAHAPGCSSRRTSRAPTAGSAAPPPGWRTPTTARRTSWEMAESPHTVQKY